MSEAVRIAPRVQRLFYGESRVEQSHKKRVNVNSIVRKALKSGLMPNRGNPGFYGDFSDVDSYQECVDKVLEADSRFMSLPSDVRKRFNNDPTMLLEFMSDPENADEAVELGILPKPEFVAPEPEPEPPVEDPPE